MAIVAEQYAFVIGVDTHAATHSLALVSAATGGVVDQAVFPNSPAGCDRALAGSAAESPGSRRWW